MLTVQIRAVPSVRILWPCSTKLHVELHVLDLVLEIFKSATAGNVNFTSYTNLSCFKINLTHIFFKFPRKTLQKYLGQKEAVNKKSRQRAEAVDTFCVPGRLSGSHTTTVE